MVETLYIKAKVKPSNTEFQKALELLARQHRELVGGGGGGPTLSLHQPRVAFAALSKEVSSVGSEIAAALPDIASSIRFGPAALAVTAIIAAGKIALNWTARFRDAQISLAAMVQQTGLAAEEIKGARAAGSLRGYTIEQMDVMVAAYSRAREAIMRGGPAPTREALMHSVGGRALLAQIEQSKDAFTSYRDSLTIMQRTVPIAAKDLSALLLGDSEGYRVSAEEVEAARKRAGPQTADDVAVAQRLLAASINLEDVWRSAKVDLSLAVLPGMTKALTTLGDTMEVNPTLLDPIAVGLEKSAVALDNLVGRDYHTLGRAFGKTLRVAVRAAYLPFWLLEKATTTEGSDLNQQGVFAHAGHGLRFFEPNEEDTPTSFRNRFDAADQHFASELKRQARQAALLKRINDLREFGGAGAAGVGAHGVGAGHAAAGGFRGHPTGAAARAGGGFAGPQAAGGGQGGWWTADRTQHAVDYLKANAGLPDISARAMVARWSGIEAGGGPNEVNSIGAVGIGQWLGSRQKGVVRGDFDNQLGHAVDELKSTEGRAYGMLQRAKTEDEAATGASQFERAEGYNSRTGRDRFVSKTVRTMHAMTPTTAQPAALDNALADDAGDDSGGVFDVRIRHKAPRWVKIRSSGTGPGIQRLEHRVEKPAPIATFSERFTGQPAR